MALIITCEHAGNQVPEKFQKWFDGQEEVLASHRGWDIGAFEIAKNLAKMLKAPLAHFTTTRLLIEPNRSLHHPELFSEFSKSFSDDDKQYLISALYIPYRSPVETFILKSKKPVVHLSIHTFTPIWNGKERTVDIGLLFDPVRTHESALCQTVKINLTKNNPGLSTKLNEPYLGIDDGFTTYLRTKFSNEEYLGIEIETNQKFANQTTYISQALYHAITYSSH